MTDIVEQLKNRVCKEGQSHVGDDWKADHGHTDCWLYGQAVTEIERLRDRLVDLGECVLCIHGQCNDDNEWE